MLESIPIQKTNSSSSSQTIPKSAPTRMMFSQVSVGHLRFIIMDCPTDATLADYVRELKIRGVTDVVRACQPSYDRNILCAEGIQVHDWAFPDGGVPPQQVLSSFIQLVEQRFGSCSLTKEQIQDKSVVVIDHPPVIAVHCVAGLGRAPVLVAVCLIEAGFAPVDAIDFIRKCRRGAFNNHQLKYLMDTYKRSGKTKSGFGFLKRAPTPPKSDGETSFLSKVLGKFKKNSSPNEVNVSLA